MPPEVWILDLWRESDRSDLLSKQKSVWLNWLCDGNGVGYKGKRGHEEREVLPVLCRYAVSWPYLQTENSSESRFLQFYSTPSVRIVIAVDACHILGTTRVSCQTPARCVYCFHMYPYRLMAVINSTPTSQNRIRFWKEPSSSEWGVEIVFW